MLYYRINELIALFLLVSGPFFFNWKPPMCLLWNIFTWNSALRNFYEIVLKNNKTNSENFSLNKSKDCEKIFFRKPEFKNFSQLKLLHNQVMFKKYIYKCKKINAFFYKKIKINELIRRCLIQKWKIVRFLVQA